MYNQGGGFYVPAITKTNKVILIALLSAFLLQSILKVSVGFSFASWFGLSWVGLTSGKIFQVLTYPLVIPSLFSFLFDALVLWFFGCELERRWGRKLYLKFIGVSVLGGSLFYILVVGLFFSNSMVAAVPLVSLHGICLAILVAYSVIFSESIIPFMLIFPMKAKYFCLILVGIEMYTAFFSGYGKASFGHLGSAGLAFLYLLYLSKSAQKTKSGQYEVHYKTKSASRKKSHLRLVDEEEDTKNPKYWQ